jgi:hypothetical protein
MKIAKKTVSLPLLLIVCSLPVFAKARTAKVEAEVPFTLEKGHIIVAAKVLSSKVPVELAIATGSEYSVINGTSIIKYKIQASYTGVGIITGRSTDQSRMYVPVADVRIGEADARSIAFTMAQEMVNQISSRIGREIFGVLGSDYFKGRTVQFDFKKKLIRFLADWQPEPQMDSLPFAAPEIRPGYPNTKLPIAEVTMNGKKIKTLFDVGALTVISVTPTAAKQMGLSVPKDKSEQLTAKAAISFVNISFPEVPVTVYAKGSPMDVNAEGYSGIIGVAALQNFITTFDFGKSVLTLERN